MLPKFKSFLFIFTLTVLNGYSQNNYLGLDYSSFVVKQKQEENFPGGLRFNILHYKGTYIGESFQLGIGGLNSLGLGIGITKIDYEKQWLGIYPDNNKFGSTTVKGKIQYISLPLSLTLVKALGRKSHFRSPGNFFRSGINFTYCPSFLTSGSFVVSRYAAADSSSFLSAYEPSVREFQHAFTIGLCSQLFFFNNNLRLAVEPYLGAGTGNFNQKQNSGNFTYGVKLQFSFLLPRISVERQVNRNSDEKKNLLLQKQKEIEEQLHKQP
ncbi:MAG TPA: hypothetical protein PL029_00315 [Bacteroidia bacterium]|nr:hypothetical protein [Bacteroidia bacterium]